MWLIIKLYLEQLCKQKASLCQPCAGTVARYKTWSRNTTGGEATASQEEGGRIVPEGRDTSQDEAVAWGGQRHHQPPSMPGTQSWEGSGATHCWWVTRGLSWAKCSKRFPTQGLWNYRTFLKVFFFFLSWKVYSNFNVSLLNLTSEI